MRLRATFTIPVALGPYGLEVEIAADPVRRALGLMFRRSMPADRGMLFVFPEDEILSFWMSNTLIPLSVGFLDADHRILNIADMEPLDDLSFHVSAAPARYGLEVHRGWFADRGIEPGDRCSFELPAGLVVL
jgi:uncharacterized protein